MIGESRISPTHAIAARSLRLYKITDADSTTVTAMTKRGRRVRPILLYKFEHQVSSALAEIPGQRLPAGDQNKPAKGS